MSAQQLEHPLIQKLRAVPQNFPEIQGDDNIARIARLIILPQLIRAARKNPDALRAIVVRFLARFVVALEIGIDEIYAPAPSLVDPEPAADTAATGPPARDLSSALAAEDAESSSSAGSRRH